MNIIINDSDIQDIIREYFLELQSRKGLAMFSLGETYSAYETLEDVKLRIRRLNGCFSINHPQRKPDECVSTKSVTDAVVDIICKSITIPLDNTKRLIVRTTSPTQMVILYTEKNVDMLTVYNKLNEFAINSNIGLK